MKEDRSERREKSMMKKIAILVAALAILLSTYPATAQQAGKVYRIGYLHVANIAKSSGSQAFFQGLRDLGYVEGRNIIIERRSAKGRRDHLAELAAELVRLKVDVIVGPGAIGQAAIKATRTIPIVITVAGDYVARGCTFDVQASEHICDVGAERIGVAGTLQVGDRAGAVVALDGDLREPHGRRVQGRIRGIQLPDELVLAGWRQPGRRGGHDIDNEVRRTGRPVVEHDQRGSQWIGQRKTASPFGAAAQAPTQRSRQRHDGNGRPNP